jgi:hypothetical protein
MDDQRVREFETALWVGGEDVYRRSIDSECLMVVPGPPFVMAGTEAIEAVSRTPRWDSVTFEDLRIARPQEGLIVLAYGVLASRGDETYSAHCTSTYRRVGHEDWQVVQHQQSLAPAAVSNAAGGSDAMERVQQEAAEERENERGYQ